MLSSVSRLGLDIFGIFCLFRQKVGCFSKAVGKRNGWRQGPLQQPPVIEAHRRPVEGTVIDVWNPLLPEIGSHRCLSREECVVPSQLIRSLTEDFQFLDWALLVVYETCAVTQHNVRVKTVIPRVFSLLLKICIKEQLSHLDP